MSTPPDLGEELVNSLSEGGGRGLGSGEKWVGGSAVSRATQRGGLRGCAWEEGWGGDRPPAARLAKPPPPELTAGWRGGPSVPGSTLRLPQSNPRCGPSFRVGFPKLPELSSPTVCPSLGLVFPPLK